MSSIFIEVERATIQPQKCMEIVNFIKTMFFNFNKVYIVNMDVKIMEELLKSEMPVLFIKENNENDIHAKYIYNIEFINVRMHQYSCKFNLTRRMYSSLMNKNKNQCIDTFNCLFSNEIRTYIPLILNKLRNFNIATRENVPLVVVDLDDTLITERIECITPQIYNKLKKLQKTSFLVLWSHGTTSHVNESLKETNCCINFDVIFSRSVFTDSCANKSLSTVFRELNRLHSVKSLGLTVLIDDLIENYENDYDIYVEIPSAKITKRIDMKAFFNKIIFEIQKKQEKINQDKSLLTKNFPNIYKLYLN